jgi:hypothetical protein
METAMLRRLTLALAALVVLAFPASSQGLRQTISQLFIFGPGEDPLFLTGTGNPNNPLNIQQHGNHFVPAAVSANGSLIEFLTTAIASNVASTPIGSTSGGATFHFEGGVPVRTSNSAGPIFAERGQTLGRGRTVFGVGHTAARMSSLRGVNLHGIDLMFTHQNVDFAGCDSIQGGIKCSQMGMPLLENDVMQFRLSLDLDVRVTSVYATYGITDRIDFGVMVPIVSTEMHGESHASIIPFGGTTVAHFFDGTASDPVLTATRAVSGNSVGVGDVAARTKVNVHQSDKSSIALLGEARFATGNADELLGSGDFAARGIAIVSTRIGDFSAHGNGGYLYRGGHRTNSAILGTVGFDQLISQHVTLAADVVSEMQVGRSKLSLPGPVQYDYPFKRTVNPTSIPTMADNIVNGSFGFKFTTNSGLTVLTNALIPINRGGLRSNFTTTLGVEYSF